MGIYSEVCRRTWRRRKIGYVLNDGKRRAEFGDKTSVNRGRLERQGNNNFTRICFPLNFLTDAGYFISNCEIFVAYCSEFLM
mmetsp:Transcript_34608/g.68129  ORF Transcript_34608/g.68129 Transcript_34608/m.68129 type:complete len:82 (-) Transcript_34608:106-351(-)